MNKKGFSERTKAILANTNKSPEGMLIDLQNNIAGFLNEKLHEQNKNKSELAKAVRMKQSQLTRILNAEENVTLKTIIRLYMAFGCKPKIIEEKVPTYGTVSVAAGTSTFQCANTSEPRTVAKIATL